ncbi:MAG: DUF3558 domain-containing protein [Pseudonocardiaceae bacterium]|nr:DUF3558 domain-containing protein [Pseudonocardiaceae bacterium]
MIFRVRTGIAVLAVAATASALAGCGEDSTEGQASPRSGEPKPTKSGPSGTNLSKQQLCELLSGQEARELSVEAGGTPGVYAGDPACKWASDKASVNLTFNNKGTSKDLNIQTKSTPVKINGRNGVLIEYPPAPNCGVVVDLTEKSMTRAMVSVLSAGQAERLDPCELAQQAATMATKKISG